MDVRGRWGFVAPVGTVMLASGNELAYLDSGASTHMIRASQLPAGAVVRQSNMSFGSMSLSKAAVSMGRVDVCAEIG